MAWKTSEEPNEKIPTKLSLNRFGG